MAEKKCITTIEGIDSANLCHAIAQLTQADVPRLEKDNYDKEFINLVKKGRKYLNLMLDAAITKYEKRSNK